MSLFLCLWANRLELNKIYCHQSVREGVRFKLLRLPQAQASLGAASFENRYGQVHIILDAYIEVRTDFVLSNFFRGQIWLAQRRPAPQSFIDQRAAFYKIYGDIDSELFGY